MALQTVCPHTPRRWAIVATAYGGHKDASAAWGAGAGAEVLAVPEDRREAWAERVAIMVADGGLPRAEAERLAWVSLAPHGEVWGEWPR